jgi:UPF0042 nucleotide-binding protein
MTCDDASSPKMKSAVGAQESATHEPSHGSPVGALVLVAGLSGAGKSVAIDTLSDLGFFSVENLPVPLFKNFVEFLAKSGAKHARAALSLDLDSRIKLEQLISILKSLRAEARSPTIVFLDAKVETIVKRYGQTRRPHPGFDLQLDKTLQDAIVRERDRLFPLREMANTLIDSSELTVHDLRAEIRSFASSCKGSTSSAMRVNFLSFGFKHGVPIDCDLVVDVRFLPNPYFVDELREKTGIDPAVNEYVFQSGAAEQFIAHYADLLSFLLPEFAKSGKSYVNVGVGCTGGRHRSVAVSGALAKVLGGRIPAEQYLVSVKHRDVEKAQ